MGRICIVLCLKLFSPQFCQLVTIGQQAINERCLEKASIIIKASSNVQGHVGLSFLRLKNPDHHLAPTKGCC